MAKNESEQSFRNYCRRITSKTIHRMKPADPKALAFLVKPVWGLGDDDESPLNDIDPNDEEQMREMFRTHFLPYYHKEDPTLLEAVKTSWKYFLTSSNPPIVFERALHSSLASADTSGLLRLAVGGNISR